MATSTKIINRVKRLFGRKPKDQNQTSVQSTSIPNTQNILGSQDHRTQQPADTPQTLRDQSRAVDKTAAAATTAPTLQVRLQNQTSNAQVYAYISKLRESS
jgi:hypothetical protein